MCSGAHHAISAPPPKEKKDRKKLDAAKAIDRPKMIWISRRKPPAVSPNASVSPVTIMMMTATIFANGPWTDSNTCCSGSSHGIPEPAACAVAARELPGMVAAAAVTILFGWRTRDRRMSFSLIVGGGVAAGVVSIWIETRSEEHTSELQSLMRISYAVLC